MTDVLLDLSAKLESVQNDLRQLAQQPAVMRAQNYPITLPEATTLINRLETMVRLWMQRPVEERRSRPERRQRDRRQTPPEADGAVA